MAKFLNTRGKASLAIALCDRCKRKFPIGELLSDPNSKGLRVCREDLDVFDPWRLPPRVTEKITLRDPRPDEGIPVVSNYLVTEDGSYILNTPQSERLQP